MHLAIILVVDRSCMYMH